MKHKFGIVLVTAIGSVLPLTGCVESHRGAAYEPSRRVVVTETPPPTVETRQIIVTEAPPPAPRREVVTKAPSTAHVWVPGYWTYSSNRYVWVPGHWELRPRPAATWVPGHWDPNPNGRGWIWTSGHWE